MIDYDSEKTGIEIKLKRIYEPHGAQDGFRIFVERLWPRGLKKSDVLLDLWLREIAPSTELRKWFGHDPQRWDEFLESGEINSCVKNSAKEIKFKLEASFMKKYCVLMLVVVGAVCLGCDKDRESSSRKNKTETVETIADLGALPLYVTDPKDNPSSPEKVNLGRLLFFDPILSGNKDVSCATCHQPEFNYAEFLETSIGVNGVGSGSKRRFLEPNDIPFVKRNSQSVLNTAFNGLIKTGTYHPEEAPMFWDLRVKSLETQALEPIKSLEEMRGNAYHEDHILDEVIGRIRRIPTYNQLFSQAFSGEPLPVNEVNLSKAIAAYERTLIAPNTRFDQYMRGDSSALSTSEKDGLNAFLVTGCAKCHSGPMFSDFKLHVLGVPDTGNRTESDAGINNSYAFRTPTLRNLRNTSPYMHSGKFTTLDQVLMFYEDIAGGKVLNPKVKRGQLDKLATHMDVNFKDISRIVEFLNTLNDDSFDKTVPASVPSGLPVKGL